MRKNHILYKLSFQDRLIFIVGFVIVVSFGLLYWLAESLLAGCIAFVGAVMVYYVIVKAHRIKTNNK